MPTMKCEVCEQPLTRVNFAIGTCTWCGVDVPYKAEEAELKSTDLSHTGSPKPYRAPKKR